MRSILCYHRANVFFPFLITVILTLTACATVGPDYVRPKSDIPSAWHSVPDPAVVPGKAMVRDWWTVFEDPMLTQLVHEAAQSNLDLKAAVARVDEARARLGVATGKRVPQVDAQGSVIRQRSSENALSNFGTETFYSSGIAASWEIDLFGRIRRSVEAATAEFQASEEDRTDVLITLYAEVARTYMNIRAYQARLAAAEGNIKSQKQVLELTRSRFKHGLTTDLDVAQAERVLASSEAEVPPLRIELSRAVNTMAVLLGRPPGNLYKELSVVGPIPLPPAKATVGVPVDLLRQRPDIRRAERQLAAQTARIGLATADLYPSLSLTGSFGYESIDTSDLFNAGSRVFTFGPSLRWNIFDGSRIRNQIKVQDALTEQALLSYEQTVLNALNEVENALVAYLEQRIRFKALKRSVIASQRSVKLSTNLYKEGLVDFQNVLDAQRDLFNFENQLAAARGNSAANFIQLYKALGGGWDPDEKPGEKASVKDAEINPAQGDRS